MAALALLVASSCSSSTPTADGPAVSDLGLDHPLADRLADRRADGGVKPDGTASADAGPPAASWAQQGTGEGYGRGDAIVLDPSGDIYVTGMFEQQLTMGGITLTSSGGADCFVARLGPGGKPLWVVPAGGSGDDKGLAIALDKAGGVYVTGYYEKQAKFGSSNLSSKGNWDIFVAKLSPTGQFLWAASAGGTNADSGKGLAVDSAGNVLVSGFYSGTATFGSSSASSKGSFEVFLAKLDAGGQFLWATSAGGPEYDLGHGLALDASDNAYMTGFFKAKAEFGTTTLTSQGDKDLFVAKFSSSGTPIWATAAGSSGFADRGNAITVDASGNSYVTGYFNGTVPFGTTSLTATDWDLFLAKLSPAGEFVWATSAGGGAWDEGLALARHPSGDLYVAGIFSGSASFGTHSIASTGDTDLFVAKFSDGGQPLWALSAGGTGWDEANGIAVDASGVPYVTGGFNSPTALFGLHPLVAKNFDAFVWKVKTP